ncbi:MAG: terminase TerL endonuclease subunit [Planctomycetota bacterium]
MPKTKKTTASTSDPCPETWRDRWDAWRASLVDDDQYYFDEAKADHAVRFIETFCRHYTGDFAGLPFILDPWQRNIVRDLWGWRRRSDDRKRFSEAYIEGPKGCGKTLWASALGTYGLAGEGVAGAEVYCVAGNTLQSSIAFDGAKRMVKAHPRLQKAIRAKQYHLEHPKSGSKLQVLSGRADGKHGLKPGPLVVGDEIHEWGDRDLYDSISSAAMKRECLMLWLTNAGVDRNSVCYELRTRAENVLTGDSSERTFYPAVFGPVDPDPKHWQNEELWKRCHPGVGSAVKLEDLRREWDKARETPALLPRNARLYLGVWTQTAASWVNLDQWDACCGELPDDDELAEFDCYVGFDLSANDDLTSVATLWYDTDADHVYVRVHNWITRPKADDYQLRDGTPWHAWAKRGRLTIVPTVTLEEDETYDHIAGEIANYGVKAIAFDPPRAGRLTNRLEELGVDMVATKPHFTGIGPTMKELADRLRAESITIEVDPLLRWQAGNVEGKADDAGNVRPVKYAARGKYEGNRAKKIDGFMAMLFALSRVVVHDPTEIGGVTIGFAG